MKRVLALLVIAVFVLSSLPVIAADAPVAIMMNESEAVSTYAKEVDGERLYPIRDICKFTGFNVDWDDSDKAALVSNENITYKVFTGTNKVMVGTTEQFLPSKVYLINNTTYVPLAFAEMLGYKTDKADFQGLTDYCVYLIEYNPETFSSYDVLLEYDVLTPDDAKLENENLTQLEAFEILGRFPGYKCDIKEWYAVDELAHLDYLWDEDKIVILKLYGDYSGLIISEDAKNLNPDSELTWLDALKYVIRLAGNSSDSGMMECEFSEKSEIYASAFRKGLIDSKDDSNAEKTITRKEFYTLITAALYKKVGRHGYGTHWTRLIDELESMKNKAEQESSGVQKEIKKITKNIPIVPKFDDEMNLSWELPADYEFIKNESYILIRELFTADGKKICEFGGFYNDDIDSVAMMGMIAESGEKEQPKTLRITYSKTYYAIDECHEYVFDFELDDISFKEHKVHLVPGTCEDLSPAKYADVVNLNEGAFKKGAYYVLKSRTNRYRKDEYNTDRYTVFTVYEDTESCTLGIDGVNSESFPTAPVVTERAYLREIIVTGDSKSGFTLSFSNWSDKCFEEIK